MRGRFAVLGEGGRGWPYADHVLDDMQSGRRLRFWTISRAPVPGDIVMSQIERRPPKSAKLPALNGSKLLTAICPSCADGAPDLTGMRLFVLPQGRGVSYRRGIWHHGLASLDGPCDIAVFMGCLSEAEDTEIRELSQPIVVPRTTLPSPGT